MKTKTNNMDAKELKPCPFCGSSDLQTYSTPSPDGSVVWHYIVHGPRTPCGVQLMDTNKERLFKRWGVRRFDADQTKVPSDKELEVFAVKLLTSMNTGKGWGTIRRVDYIKRKTAAFIKALSIPQEREAKES